MRRDEKAIGSLLALLYIASSTGCEERTEQREARQSIVVEEKSEAPQTSWIRRNDDIDPAVWLASKEAGRQLGTKDPAVLRLRKAFEGAEAKYLESDRMIANRTAQLEDMLAKDGKPEAAADIVEGLSTVIGVGRGKETYGELCQFYFTLRHNGADREAALAELQTRYGAYPR